MSSLKKDTCENEDLTDEQVEILENNFKKCKQPDGASLMLTAAEAGLSDQETMKWFIHRLSKWRTSEGLPAKSGSVMD